MASSTDEEEYGSDLRYNIVAVAIFSIVSFNFLFPCNPILPLDRRTVAVFGAVVCFASRRFIFSSKPMHVESEIDFDVLMLLAAIMAINFIVVNLAETKSIIDRMQNAIKDNPERGFWYVSTAAFVVAPFLTNDGVCLLMVEPIIRAFESTFVVDDEETPAALHDDRALISDGLESSQKLQSTDCIYFLLSLACSSNIGSALTYTGNPQNMIVSQDALSVMSPGLFLAYQILPSLLSWLITTYWILMCWRSQKQNGDHKKVKVSDDVHMIGPEDGAVLPTLMVDIPPHLSNVSSKAVAATPLSPRQRRMRENMLNRVSYIVFSPIPLLAIVILVGMIVFIFLNVVSIAALVCMTAVLMVVALVVGNHWRGKPIWGRADGEEIPVSKEERKESLADFFEELFQSIDYSLLLIFLGTFVVVGNLDSTGIPSAIWSKIVGDSPFNTIRSVIGISLFVLISSQLLGNVAVCQMARPNVEPLGDAEKKYAWAVISFVATVGGNLTITGSAANIIVSEKVARLDPQSSIDFFKHYRVCFWITLFSCALGSLIITWISMLESHTTLVW